MRCPWCGDYFVRGRYGRPVRGGWVPHSCRQLNLWPSKNGEESMEWLGNNGKDFPATLNLSDVARHVVEIRGARHVKTEYGEQTAYDVMLWSGPESASVPKTVWSCAALDGAGGLLTGSFYLLDCKGGVQSRKNKRNTYNDVRVAKLDESDMKILAKGGSIDDLIGMTAAKTPF